MGAGCDRVRGLALHVANTDPDAGASTHDISLCPEARVYGYKLCGGFEQTDPPSPPPEPPELVAVIKLQDSQLELWSDCCTLDRDLPGLRWPDKAQLIVAPGAIVTLNIDYGNCGCRDAR